MALDPNIALGVRGIEVANPLAQYAQVSQLQSAQNQNALAQYQLATAQREQESTNALNEAYRSAYNPQTGEIDVNTLRKTLSTGGFGSKLPGLEKMLGELQTQKLQAQKLQGEVTAQPIALQIQQANLADTKLKQSRAFLDTINPADPNAPAMYLKWHQANHSDPVIGPMLAARGVTADQSRAQIDAAIAQGPQAFAQLLNQSKLGTEKFMELNKPNTQVIDQSGQRQLVQTPGLGGAPTTIGTYADVPLPANVQAQKIQIAQQSRPPAQPAQPSAPVAVVDENGKVKYVTREQSLGMTPATAIEGLSPKEIQKREAVLPQARQAVKTVGNTMSVIGETVDRLLANPDGLNGITGTIYGRTPAFTDAANTANADLEQLRNLAFVQGLTELRAASKTGAGVGNVSNREGERFENLKASLDRRQSKTDLENALRRLKEQASFTTQTMQEAFDETYKYKQTAPAPAATQGTGGFKYLGKASD